MKWTIVEIYKNRIQTKTETVKCASAIKEYFDYVVKTQAKITGLKFLGKTILNNKLL